MREIEHIQGGLYLILFKGKQLFHFRDEDSCLDICLKFHQSCKSYTQKLKGSWYWNSCFQEMEGTVMLKYSWSIPERFRHKSQVLRKSLDPWMCFSHAGLKWHWITEPRTHERQRFAAFHGNCHHSWDLNKCTHFKSNTIIASTYLALC